jgi:hypothetical protein
MSFASEIVSMSDKLNVMVAEQIHNHFLPFSTSTDPRFEGFRDVLRLSDFSAEILDFARCCES